MDRPDVLFIYNNFYPAWKAGGPVQSLNNLATALSAKMKIAVICSACELNETQPMSSVVLRQWNDVLGVKVYYLAADEQNYSSIKSLIEKVNARVVYINGLYSLPFVVAPFLAWQHKFKKQMRMIISPRGMVQEGALKVKPLKKNIFLTCFKLLGLHNNVSWHATDKQEVADIKRVFGQNANASIVPNIPKKPLASVAPIIKKEDELSLVYLSLITAKKNLYLALSWLKELNLPLSFDIYGPVKDQTYWRECLTLIDTMPPHIKVVYCGEVKPSDVQATFANYHALFLPTKGENFGHAIYECLSVGRPVIISDNTPWQDLEDHHAGSGISLQDPAVFLSAITTLFKMDQDQYDVLARGAFALASNYFYQNKFEELYLQMFA